MKIAITGGTGFVGGAAAEQFLAAGHEIVLIARGQDARIARFRGLGAVTVVEASVADEESLVPAFEGCDVVLHCAGINREIGEQTFEAVHVQGTRNVVSAAKRCGVGRIALLSYLRARPDCGSGYLESKWAAEEIVRSSGLDYLVLKATMIYGRGDHMLDHLAKSIGTFHLVGTVGLRDRTVAPVAVSDVVEILHAFVAARALSNRTVAVVGPERLRMGEAVRRTARVIGSKVAVIPMPIAFLYALGWLCERLMVVPLVAVAQVRLLREGPEPGPLAESLPPELEPRQRFDDDVIRLGLPDRQRYGFVDLRRRSGSRILLRTEIAASPERCFDLCRDVDVHLDVPGARETAVAGVRSGTMELGDTVTWRSRRLGVPVHMTSKITAFDRPHRFVDEMLKGPFASWRHEHRFVPVPGGTLMTDEIRFKAPLGVLGRIVESLFLRRYMSRLVQQQNAHIQSLAESGS